VDLAEVDRSDIGTRSSPGASGAAPQCFQLTRIREGGYEGRFPIKLLVVVHGIGRGYSMQTESQYLLRNMPGESRGEGQI